ncbi:beta-galactosidase [Paenibacillus cisolokensis]|uniref:beta-galactosidase n=1 Tax=Paenibacillus cisolokensis TaxID=1658519 RepID=UPI003D2C6E85
MKRVSKMRKWRRNVTIVLLSTLLIIPSFLSGEAGNAHAVSHSNQKEKEISVNSLKTHTNTTFPVVDFEDGIIPSFVTDSNSTLEIIDNVTGSKALKVTYGIADFPTVKFTAETYWDFGEQSALSFEVTNPTNEDITFYVRMDDDKQADGVVHSMVSIGVAKANSTEKLFLSLSSDVQDIGMRFLPPNPAGSQLSYGWGEKSLNARHIVEFQFWQMYTSKESVLIFDNIQVISDPNSDLSYLDGLVDRYGQYTGMYWEGKVYTQEDLIEDKEQELKWLEETAPPIETSKYGGWLNGPKLEGTGHFRVTKHNGKWTLVDPEGYLFFSTGLDIVRLADMNTWVTGRWNMFYNLPSRFGPLADHYHYSGVVARPPLNLTEGWLFNHYSANLERKYGENYLEEWKDITVKRFKTWGFTSIGNWSEPELFYGKGDEHRMPYVAHVWTHFGDHTVIPGRNSTVPDPFDPDFVVSVGEMLQDQILAYGVAEDEWLLGVFVDNELEWGNSIDTQNKYLLITNIMAMDAADESSYAKRAMVEHLKKKYQNDIDTLNQTWGTTFNSFADLEAPFRPEAISEGMVSDYSEMLKFFAEQYFRIVRDELKKVLPNTLYLGSRFANWGTSKEVQEAAAKYVDVISFNVYKQDVVGENWMYLEDLDMPAIIGEFTFGANDRGMFGTGPVADTAASSQQERAEKFLHFMTTVLENEYFVGAHWFQYVDQPLLGRAWDGENYNIGFVDVADVPYEAMVQAARKLHAELYDIRFSEKKEQPESGDEGEEFVLLTSFESSENLNFIHAYKEAKVDYVTDGATDGSRAMKITVGTLDTDYSGVELRPEKPWNLGRLPRISLDVTNPSNSPIQVRINVKDQKGAIRTYYFNMAENEARTLVIEQFGPSSPVWESDGFWGAEDGLDTSRIHSLNLYLWEDADFDTGDTFIIDNVMISN